MKSKKQKDVIASLQKSVKTRGKGLSKPPILSSAIDNVLLDENSEAVAVSSSRRTYRVSTFISEGHGDTLDELILTIKKIDGKKPKISQVLEMALTNLKSNLNP